MFIYFFKTVVKTKPIRVLSILTDTYTHTYGLYCAASTVFPLKSEFSFRRETMTIRISLCCARNNTITSQTLLARRFLNRTVFEPIFYTVSCFSITRAIDDRFVVGGRSVVTRVRLTNIVSEKCG